MKTTFQKRHVVFEISLTNISPNQKIGEKTVKNSQKSSKTHVFDDLPLKTGVFKMRKKYTKNSKNRKKQETK